MKPADTLLAAARSVIVCTPDFCGRLVGKERPIRDWPRLRADGLMMPDFHLVTSIENRPLPGFAVAGADLGFRNGRLMPDPASAFIAPGDASVLHVLADVRSAEGRVVAEAPRQVLKAQIELLAAAGITATCASELEFYLYRQSFGDIHASRDGALTPFYHRHGDNDVLVAALASPFCQAIVEGLDACGIKVDQIQGEGGVGQFEVNVEPAAALQAADDHVVFKHVVKALAHAAGHAVTFLAKPMGGDAGSGGHIHMSLTRDGANALDDRGSLSHFGRSFLAGLLAFTPQLTLLHAPYANSYRRLAPGAFTPLRSTWGRDNRTAMVRVVEGGSGVRFELRLPGADVNPYHSYAAAFIAGLAGVEAGLDLPAEKIGAAEPADSLALPADLTEAVAAFQVSALAQRSLGEAVHEHVLQHGRHELAATRQQVTPWEVARGFENA